MTERWRIRLSASAEQDFEAILRWTVEAFGIRQAEVYLDLLLAALAALAHGPDVPGSKLRDEILPGLRILHVRRPGRHFVLYRPSGSNTIEVVRILHDAMDLARHVVEDDPKPEASQAD